MFEPVRRLLIGTDPVKLLLVLVCVLLVSCQAVETVELPEERNIAITVGGLGGGYTEHTVLFKLLSIYLREKGYEVTDVPDIDIVTAHSALLEGKIDVYWEYTAYALAFVWNMHGFAEAQASYNLAKEKDAANGLIWLEMAEANSSYGVFMNRERAKSLAIQSYSDLMSAAGDRRNQIIFAANSECLGRFNCMDGLLEHYGIEIEPDNIRMMTAQHFYNALRNDQVDVVIGCVTDSQIDEDELLVLDDDKSFFPPYNAVPVIRRDVLQRHPELEELINELPRRLDLKTLMGLRHAVAGGKNVTEVVRTWLIAQQLIL